MFIYTKIKKSVLLLFILIPIILKSQTENNCNVKKVLIVHQNIDNLSEQNVLDFLLTFNKSCKKNVEYSEFSREVLYELLDKNPLILIEVMDRFNSEIDKEYILYRLKSSNFDFKEILLKLRKIEEKSIVKNEIINILKIQTEQKD